MYERALEAYARARVDVRASARGRRFGSAALSAPAAIRTAAVFGLGYRVQGTGVERSRSTDRRATAATSEQHGDVLVRDRLGNWNYQLPSSSMMDAGRELVVAAKILPDARADRFNSRVDWVCEFTGVFHHECDEDADSEAE